MGNPKSLKGGAEWVLFGAGAGLIALVVASLFPSIIPARAAQQRL